MGGRTTHGIALAKALTAKKQKVLLVDGDLEAPGISWLFEQRLPNPPVFLADFLALVHGDPSPDAATAIELVSDRLQNAFIDGIFILPSFRANSGFTSLEIRPEHLIQGSQNAFLLDNGVVIQEKDEYYMPEIFRYGLKFTLKSGARPRVLSLARRAGQSS